MYSRLICEGADWTHRTLSVLDEFCVGHSNILFKRNPLVTPTEETVDPYQVLYFVNCLKLVFKQELSIFLNYLSHPAVVKCKVNGIANAGGTKIKPK